MPVPLARLCMGQGLFVPLPPCPSTPKIIKTPVTRTHVLRQARACTQRDREITEDEEEQIVWAKAGLGIWGFGHVFEGKLLLHQRSC